MLKRHNFFVFPFIKIKKKEKRFRMEAKDE